MKYYIIILYFSLLAYFYFYNMINIRKKLVNLYNFKYIIFILLIFLLRVMIKNLKYKPL